VRSVSLLLLLSCTIVLLGPLQCLSRLAVASRLPTLASQHDLPATHTREEVSDKPIDFARESRRQCVQSAEAPEPSYIREFVEDVEVEIIPPRRLLHRQVSPPSPDDAFHLA
jgi:hypothetical protein